MTCTRLASSGSYAPAFGGHFPGLGERHCCIGCPPALSPAVADESAMRVPDGAHGPACDVDHVITGDCRRGSVALGGRPPRLFRIRTSRPACPADSTMRNTAGDGQTGFLRDAERARRDNRPAQPRVATGAGSCGSPASRPSPAPRCTRPSATPAPSPRRRGPSARRARDRRRCRTRPAPAHTVGTAVKPRRASRLRRSSPQSAASAGISRLSSPMP